MRISVVLRYMGAVMLCVSAFMAMSATISYIEHDSGFYPLLLSSLLTLMLGLFPMMFVPKTTNISNKEGFTIVVGSWLMSCIVGMFPYLIWGGEFSGINAWFESVSGFTTTGASILTNIEALPRGLLFWRSATCWMGGAGVVMFALLILPSLGTNKMALSSIELSSLAKDNYRYRSQVIVRILLVVYVGLTVATAIMLKVAGMSWWDSVNHAMSACATGGFSTKNNSIAFFNSGSIEVVLMVAMFLSSIHFGLIYATFTRRANNIFRSEVVRAYIGIILAVALAIAISLRVSNIYPDLFTSLRQSLFQVVSLISTTGFGTADTNVWTPLAIILLMTISMTCGCAGSTAGGIKTDRVLLFGKLFRARIRQQQHPNAIFRVRVDDTIQEESQMGAVMIFISTYFFLIILGTITATMFGQDLLTALSSAVACIGNVGPGFGEVGSMSNFAEVPNALKFQDTILMLMGRLEIFGFIQFMFIKFWK